MKDTRLKPPPLRPQGWARGVRAAVAILAALAALSLWMLNWGCADARKEPLTPAEPGYTETIDLWNSTPTGSGSVATATFTVAQQLAPINVPGQDTPARLRVAAFIVPDCQIYRRLQIMQDSVPYILDSLIIRSLVELTNKKTALALDSVHTHRVDSLEAILRVLVDSLKVSVSPTDSQTQFTWHGRTVACDSALFRMVPNPADTAHVDSILASVGSGFAAINDTLSQFEMQLIAYQLDTARLGREQVYLNTLLDNRYVLSVALDSTSTFYVPNAVYTDAAGHVSGQEIYSAALDTTAGFIARGFTLALDRLQAADITHLGHTFEVNWAVCFAGSDRPCLSPGQHTLYVRVPGRSARVTGTIVLVYAQRV